MVGYALKEHDPAVRMNFCYWFLRSVHDGEAQSQLVFLPAEHIGVNSLEFIPRNC
jgi:hypothetical protein